MQPRDAYVVRVALALGRLSEAPRRPLPGAAPAQPAAALPDGAPPDVDLTPRL
jgi:hypothetical protein